MVLFIAVACLPLMALLARGSPHPASNPVLRLRADTDDTDPDFPSSVASCEPCEDNYDAIKLCMSVVPAMANSSTILSNIGSFIDTITCACSDPFHSTYGSCVDCFQQTDQTDLLNTTDPSAVIAGINKVCALEGALFGSGDKTSISTSGATAAPTGAHTSTGAAATPTTGAATPTTGAATGAGATAPTTTAAPASSSSSSAVRTVRPDWLFGASVLLLGSSSAWW